ncbi:PDZ domain-containing protein 11-like [Pecten maximus]|uniref:PDZ domain-containing protein 11-like n=1 Tax=Pecten maximus TaxID=6579 RepID=UPI001458F4F8|nr:PDZ domain-containing protein 11-like [Pecten maximus]
MTLDGKELVYANLPDYEDPPEWIHPHDRPYSEDYSNEIHQFLPRQLILQRNQVSEQLGFNIRGGKEHHCGIYVSKVTMDSEADKLGLQEADQILSVNRVNFEEIDHAEAVNILKRNTSINMQVRYFPYGYDRTYDKSRYLLANHQQSPNSNH